MATTFYGGGQFALMSGAVSGNPARDYLTSFGHESAKNALVFVINIGNLVLTKTANLFPFYFKLCHNLLYLLFLIFQIHVATRVAADLQFFRFRRRPGWFILGSRFGCAWGL